jgi:hypothetical protein
LSLGRHFEAEAALRAALEGARQTAATHDEARIAVLLARTYAELGRKGAARRLLRTARRVYSRSGASKQAEVAEAMLQRLAA